MLVSTVSAINKVTGKKQYIFSSSRTCRKLAGLVSVSCFVLLYMSMTVFPVYVRQLKACTVLLPFSQRMFYLCLLRVTVLFRWGFGACWKIGPLLGASKAAAVRMIICNKMGLRFFLGPTLVLHYVHI